MSWALKNKIFKLRFLLLYCTLYYHIFSSNISAFFLFLTESVAFCCHLFSMEKWPTDISHSVYSISLGIQRFKKPKVKAFKSYSQRFLELYAMRYKYDMTLQCCKCFPAASSPVTLVSKLSMCVYITSWYLRLVNIKDCQNMVKLSSSFGAELMMLCCSGTAGAVVLLDCCRLLGW